MKPFLMFPPHPNNSMALPAYKLPSQEEKRQWVAQRKFNGTHIVLFVHNNNYGWWNRHGVQYQLWPDMIECIKGMNLKKDTTYIFNGEWMGKKAKNKITGKQALDKTFIFFDLLYYETMLVSLPFVKRYELLKEICGNPTQKDKQNRGFIVSAYKDSQIWLAELFEENFLDRFYDLFDYDERGIDLHPEIEGLVLKHRGNRSIIRAGQVAYDVDWMMRVRKPERKKYMF